ncbi:zinc finger MYM-type protein 4 isoform X1 [Culicoides brevitarsis]|uniref:zinc finger MYM-type protein 4 isoform X1 n=1 Tax=Culicoides brevitarsis TaxID=469753 RepID=UPI00307C7FC6
MDDQSDVSAVQKMDEENPEPTPEAATVDPPAVASEQPADSSMEVDDAAFEDALESIAGPPTDLEAAPKATEDEPETGEELKNMSTDDVPEENQQEVGETPDETTENEQKDDGEQPHAMAIHDVPEHEHGQQTDQDPNSSVAQMEKSMDVTLHNSSAIDPFDAVKQTSSHDESVNNESNVEDTSLNATNVQAVPESEEQEEHEQTNDDVDTSAYDNDNDVTEVADATTEDKDQADEEEHEEETSHQKETEEVADDAIEEINDGENEHVELLPDCEREISEADKERARQAREESDKADQPQTLPDDENLEEDEPEPTVDLTDDVDASAIHIFYVLDKLAPCHQCKETKACAFRLKENEDEPNYFCGQSCVDAFTAEQTDKKYVVRRKKYVAEENPSATEENVCSQCEESKVCKFVVQQEDEKIFLCEDECLNNLLEEQADRIRVKRARVRETPASQEAMEVDPEANKFNARTEEEAETARVERENSFVRRCAQCANDIQLDPRTLNWEAMDFCNEQCLSAYQNVIGATCTTCSSPVPATSLGKYCVRFGFEVRQFCRSECLNEYKKGVKVCTYCQMDIGADEPGFLAPVGEKGQFKDFCTQVCMKKYEEVTTPPAKRRTHNAICAVCQVEKPSRVQVTLDNKELNFCTSSCLSAFQFVNNVVTDQCGLCCKHFERKENEAFTLYPGTTEFVVFCSKICMNIYITSNRKIVPCQWCKVKKYDFDMIRKITTNVVMCSLNCVTLCELSVNAMQQTRVKCDQCKAMKQSQYHLTMSDNSIRNFCTYQCVMSFQSRFSKEPLTLDQNESEISAPVPTGLPKRVKKNASRVQSQVQSRSTSRTQTSFLQQFSLSRNYGDTPPRPQETRPVGRLPPLPLITNARSLAPFISKGKGKGKHYKGIPCPDIRVLLEPLPTLPSTRVVIGEDGEYLPPRKPPPKIEFETYVVHMPREVKEMSNMSTQCDVITENQEVNVKPEQATQELQTDSDLEEVKTCILPVPIFIPTPIRSFALPRPVPKPFIFPIPVPVFIPITKSTAASVMKLVQKNKKVDVAPADPFEAELLMMAEAVAGAEAKKPDEPQSVDDNNFDNPQFDEDIVQMALKMATNDYDMNSYAQQPDYGRKRPQLAPVKAPSKRIKSEPTHHMPAMVEPHRQPAEKPDANMCLKYTFGVNAWKQWVVTKNAELEKSSFRRKPFKTEILQMTADELNYSLCLFVKEVRKPNGSEYAPDTIYYLVLGIQQYLYENGRIDNIFTDIYYEKFTDCLDEVAKKFSVLYNDSQYIVTRVEEEHLWECKQLGAHSPHVLLSTLMFFNTKFFNLVQAEEHIDLSFSHIMKHWKRNPGQGGKGSGTGGNQGSRNVLLRYYPPQAYLAANARKKKVYEQQENEENPLRCPVKLYEFYLSKCPESVKTRNDVFYLQPERSCVPDSPVWYSTQPLNRHSLAKMLHRVKMVKEINIALLTS